MNDTPRLRERFARALTAYRMFIVSRGRISLEEWCVAAREDPTDIHDYHAAAILMKWCGLADLGPEHASADAEEHEPAAEGESGQEPVECALLPLQDALALVRQMTAVHAAAVGDALRNMVVKSGPDAAGAAGVTLDETLSALQRAVLEGEDEEAVELLERAGRLKDDG